MQLRRASIPTSHTVGRRAHGRTGLMGRTLTNRCLVPMRVSPKSGNFSAEDLGKCPLLSRQRQLFVIGIGLPAATGRVIATSLFDIGSSFVEVAEKKLRTLRRGLAPSSCRTGLFDGRAAARLGARNVAIGHIPHPWAPSMPPVTRANGAGVHLGADQDRQGASKHDPRARCEAQNRRDYDGDDCVNFIQLFTCSHPFPCVGELGEKALADPTPCEVPCESVDVAAHSPAKRSMVVSPSIGRSRNHSVN